MPKSRRQDIREFLIEHFNNTDTPQTVECCLNSYITHRELGADYKLKTKEVKTSKNTSKKSRVRLRDQISQELGVVKQMGLIGRARYGVYVKKSKLR
jgi:hypothetical protein